LIRKVLLTSIAASLCSAPALAQGIVRHTNPPPAIILGGVTIPPGAEILMLSGQLASPIDPAKTEGIEAYGDTKTQTISTFKKIEAALAKQGYAMSDVVKLTVFVVGDPKLGGFRRLQRGLSRVLRHGCQPQSGRPFHGPGGRARRPAIPDRDRSDSCKGQVSSRSCAKPIGAAKAIFSRPREKMVGAAGIEPATPPV
jgi:enamine deaminase RidA (YjgF/YER057c/UK114 family)